MNRGLTVAVIATTIAAIGAIWITPLIAIAYIGTVAVIAITAHLLQHGYTDPVQ